GTYANPQEGGTGMLNCAARTQAESLRSRGACEDMRPRIAGQAVHCTCTPVGRSKAACPARPSQLKPRLTFNPSECPNPPKPATRFRGKTLDPSFPPSAFAEATAGQDGSQDGGQAAGTATMHCARANGRQKKGSYIRD